MRPRNPNKYYFAPEVETHIVDFLAATTQSDRDAIWETHLHEPCRKLVECIFNKNMSFNSKIAMAYDYAHWESLGMSKCFEVLKSFDPKKGKAFSYLSVSLKNYFMGQNIRQSTDEGRHMSLDSFDDNNTAEKCRYLMPAELIHHDGGDINIKEYLKLFCNWLDNNKTQLKISNKNMPFVNILIKVFQTPEDIEFSKVYAKTAKKRNIHAVHHHIRALGWNKKFQSTQNKVINYIKTLHVKKYQEYLETGEVK